MEISTLSIQIAPSPRANEQEQIEIVVSNQRLCNLVEEAAEFGGLYELLLIQRPGDILHYLDATIQALPEELKPYFSATEVSLPKSWQALSSDGTMSWQVWSSDGKSIAMRFAALDEQIQEWWDDDCENYRLAWSRFVESTQFHAFVQAVFKQLNDSIASLKSVDDLIRFNAKMVADNTHPLSMLSRDMATRVGHIPPTESVHSNLFLNTVKKYLADPLVSSCMYFGKGDRQILRLMVSEQLRRAQASNVMPREAFPLAANGADFFDARALGAEMTNQHAGLSKIGDLFIVDNPYRDTAIDLFIEKRMSAKWVISTTVQALNASLVSGDETTGCFVYQFDKDSHRPSA